MKGRYPTNKDKQLEFIAQQRKEHACPQDNYGLGYFKALEDMENKIQPEPEETKGAEIDAFKTNFDVITESPEQLADYFYDVNKLYAESVGMNMTQSKEDGVAEFLKWLNEKAGE